MNPGRPFGAPVNVGRRSGGVFVRRRPARQAHGHLGCTGALVPRRGSVYPRPVARTAAGASARDVSGTVPPVNAARRAETEGMTAPPARNGWRRRREMTMRSLTRAGFLAGLALAVGHPAVAQETETQPANGAE